MSDGTGAAVAYIKLTNNASLTDARALVQLLEEAGLDTEPELGGGRIAIQHPDGRTVEEIAEKAWEDFGQEIAEAEPDEEPEPGATEETADIEDDPEPDPEASSHAVSDEEIKDAIRTGRHTHAEIADNFDVDVDRVDRIHRELDGVDPEDESGTSADDAPDEPSEDSEEKEETAECQYCGEAFKPRGVGPHERHCPEQPDADDEPDIDKGGRSLQEQRADAILDAMEGRGWMASGDIADEAGLEQRQYFYNVRNAVDRLDDRIESRPREDGQGKEYRVVDDTHEPDASETPDEEERDPDAAPSAPDTSDADEEPPVCTVCGDDVDPSTDDVIETGNHVYEHASCTSEDVDIPDVDPDAAPETPEDRAAETLLETEMVDTDTADPDAGATTDGEDPDPVTVGSAYDVKRYEDENGDQIVRYLRCVPCGEVYAVEDDDGAIGRHVSRERHNEWEGYAVDPRGQDAIEAVETAAEDAEQDHLGPASLGKIVNEGTFRRYTCTCGAEFAGDDAERRALDHAEDEGHMHGWEARDRVEQTETPHLGDVRGPNVMRE